jgi:membrane-associated phospholipid phosphatase
VAVVLGICLLSANVTVELLKPLLSTPRPVDFLSPTAQISDSSWPSGHATAAVSILGMLALAVGPAARRPVAIAGAVLTALVCAALAVGAWHFPSDVLGGVLVGLAWTLVAAAALHLLHLRNGERGLDGAGAALRG